ncbi:MAG: YfbK domain-containing protein, partial [Bacteroidota bacterium]
KENMPPSNLVFLLDVSGSMSYNNKLPLVKKSFKLLVQQLREEDKVSIVVYAGSSGLVLSPTAGSDKNKIIGALDKLHAGGSTAGAAGIQLAYQTAQEAFIENGNNRVILATDGDFNVGTSSDSELVKLIEEKRKTGIALTILGFGMGNLKDRKMEKIADNGNGNYAYIDNFEEAKKIFVKEIGGTLHTIAKDVKLQIEFNPAHVKEYRLIGYENRKLLDEDFNNDQKDAGDLGAGHTVTALYEIVPASANETLASTIDDLKYQTRTLHPMAQSTPEWMTIKLRYKEPDKDNSKLLEVTTTDEGITLAQASENFKWSAAVASFGMVLRDSQYKGNADLNTVLDLAKKQLGKMSMDTEKSFWG